MVTETAAWSATMTAESSATGISVSAIEVASVEVAATGVSVIGEAGVGISMVDVSTTIGISTIDISTIDISTIDISAAISIPASVVFALKTPPIKATAIEISGIPSFEKRPIVGIVGIIPIVTVPDRLHRRRRHTRRRGRGRRPDLQDRVADIQEREPGKRRVGVVSAHRSGWR